MKINVFKKIISFAVVCAAFSGAFAVETSVIIGDSTVGKVDKSNNNKLNLEQSEFLKGNVRIPFNDS